jgi:AAA+ superfamily predicted ATPase
MDMPASPPLDSNQADLVARIGELKTFLARRAKTPPEASPPRIGPAPASADASASLRRLEQAFGLSPFERDTLLLCAGMEIDGEIPGLCATAQGDAARAYPTFALALAVLPGAHWSALSPEAPLRHWRLIEVGAGPVLTQAPLRIDERVLHFLVGVGQLDARLAALLVAIPPTDRQGLVPSQAAIAEQIAQIWSGAAPGGELPVMQLRGVAPDCRPIAAAAAGLLGLGAVSLMAERLPSSPAELESLVRLWEREAVLSGTGVLFVDCDDTLPAETDSARARAVAVASLLERASGPVILREREPSRVASRRAIVLDVEHPTRDEQLTIWRDALGEGALDVADLTATVAQFSLSPPAIRAIALEARERRAASPPPAASGMALWDLCRQRMRGALDGLAHRIETNLHWEDIVLPATQKQTLRTIAAQLRQRGMVYDRWGFGQKSRRGQGLSALFYGPSGTGKTMAAEVLASELRLDLYHIDLSRVVSKYIGETEANLRRVFDAAEDNGAILLFDEADSLFGARSEVKDSHDRYANIEVSYLLQRMEAYRGLAILTTNMRAALDQAFLRRLRFAVSFPFPDAPQRAAIWRQVFPAATQTEGLDADRLAMLRIAGGNIQNIALNAAFLAADGGEPVQMQHLREAALAEYAKLDRRLTQSESEAWA